MSDDEVVTYCLIVTGERDWTDKAQVQEGLDLLLHSLKLGLGPGRKLRFVLRHGVSGNVDTWANEWGLSHQDGVVIERFRAEWTLPHGGIDYSAGPRRNGEMADAEPRANLCLAFWSGHRKRRGGREQVSGTLDMITTAVQRGILVRIMPPRRPT